MCVAGPVDSPPHWCAGLALRAGWPNADRLSVSRTAGIADAWAAVTIGCGVGEDQLAQEIARTYRLRTARWDMAEAQAIKLVPERVARKHLVFPLREDNRSISIASADPNDMAAEQEIGFASGRQPIFEVAPPSAIQAAIQAGYAPEDTAASLLKAAGTDLDHDIQVARSAAPKTIRAEETAAAPVVGLTNLILYDAVKDRASDIHIEPGRTNGVVRFRVDGLLREYLQLPMAVFDRVVSRIKVLGELDIADRMRPQDGRTRIRLADGKTVDLRLSTVPTRESEKIVIRILDSASTRRLHDVGLSPPELARVRELISHRDGIILLTGPTGSGKTTTLYAAIQEIATGKLNITTIEDPVEYEVAGITQIQVEAKRGVSFASSLRAVLRQDPDVIFVGEIRDHETALTAAQAALTGHLVLSTLHTNDAVGVVARLADLGLDRPTIATALRGAVAQRLMRRLCPHCSVPVPAELTADEDRLSRLIGVRPPKRAVGCEKCGQAGFLGRIAVAEVFVVSPDIEQMIAGAEPATALVHCARAEGMRGLSEVAIDAVKAGESTLEELERVIGLADFAPATSRRRCLMVDDDPVIRALAAGLLRGEGFEVQEATDGDTALAILAQSDPPTLVILDLGLPGMDGREVLRRIRTAVATRGLPVVILTGSEDESLEPVIIDEGADDYLRKPIEPARFVARVRAVLRRSGKGQS